MWRQFGVKQKFEEYDQQIKNHNDLIEKMDLKQTVMQCEKLDEKVHQNFKKFIAKE